MNLQAFTLFGIPESCPFSIQKISAIGPGTYLIREHDEYGEPPNKHGEFPHIYAKICTADRPRSQPHKYGYRRYSYSRYLNGRSFDDPPEETCTVIVLSDTGSGTEVPNASFLRRPDGTPYRQPQPEVWNLRTFLEYTINPDGKIPYLVMTTHCHYDHIQGIGKLPPTLREASPFQRPPTTVLTSSHAKSFVTPYSNLQKNSLCGSVGLQAPKYDVGIWAEDMSSVMYNSTFRPTRQSPGSPEFPIPTPYTILHTPGHTPDSLSWYDAELRLLCVGDSFYVKESRSTKDAKWGPEPAMPVMFDLESDLKDWWASLEKVLEFVRKRNEEVEDEKEDVVEGGVRVEVEADTKEKPEGKVEKKQYGDEEDEGFVLIEAAETQSAEEDELAPVTKADRSSSLSIRPSETQKQRTAAQTMTTPEAASKSQWQTGFDMPPLDQRALAVMPTTSASSLLTPIITPSSTSKSATTPFTPSASDRPQIANLTNGQKFLVHPRPRNDQHQTLQSTLDPDPWMLVLNRDKPVQTQVKPRNPTHNTTTSFRLPNIPLPAYPPSPLPQHTTHHPSSVGDFSPFPTGFPIADHGVIFGAFNTCLSSPRPPTIAGNPASAPKPRVRLCAAHTTLAVDAEFAILTMRMFMARVLQDSVPCKRVEDGPRGEERWLWDYALAGEGWGQSVGPVQSGLPGKSQALGLGSGQRGDDDQQEEVVDVYHGYSVLAPIEVVEQGRRTISAGRGENERVGRGGRARWGWGRRPAGVA